MISKWEEEQERIAARNAKTIRHPTMVYKGTGDYDLEFNGGRIQLSRAETTDGEARWTFWAVILEEDYDNISFGGTQHVSSFANDAFEALRKELDAEN